jgi:serine protease inhibitor
MLVKKGAAVLAVALLLAACSKPVATGTEISFKNREQLAHALDQRVVAAQNHLGLKLHRELLQESPATNVVLSPISISTALAMAYNGSAGETRAALGSFTGWDQLEPDQLNEEYRKLGDLFKQAGNGVRMHSANSLWLRKDWSFHQSFVETNQRFYNAKVNSVNLQSKKTLDSINKWVKEQTEGRIQQILTQPLSDAAVSVLVNAVSFQGKWKHEFPSSLTVDASFKLADGKTKQLPMMSLGGRFEYKETPAGQAIRLPYGDGQMGMLIIVPSEQGSLSVLHEKLWADPSEWKDPFPSMSADLKLPRFQAEYGNSLVPAMNSLGLTLPFSQTQADFSAIAPTPPKLFISDIQHKAFIQVNEKGTDAAAATAIVTEAGSAPPNERFSMTVDRPFFFAIEDRQTGAWLFVGSVYDPK